jgi:hypothetical protein
LAFDFPPRFLFYNRFYITAHRVRELDREIVKGVVSERRAEQEESAKNKNKILSAHAVEKGIKRRARL